MEYASSAQWRKVIQNYVVILNFGEWSGLNRKKIRKISKLFSQNFEILCYGRLNIYCGNIFEYGHS